MLHMWGSESIFFRDFLLPETRQRFHFCSDNNPKHVINVEWLRDEICATIIDLLSKIEQLPDQPFLDFVSFEDMARLIYFNYLFYIRLDLEFLIGYSGIELAQQCTHANR